PRKWRNKHLVTLGFPRSIGHPSPVRREFWIDLVSRGTRKQIRLAITEQGKYPNIELRSGSQVAGHKNYVSAIGRPVINRLHRSTPGIQERLLLVGPR